jgi:hypothetical protein
VEECSDESRDWWHRCLDRAERGDRQEEVIFVVHKMSLYLVRYLDRAGLEDGGLVPLGARAGLTNPYSEILLYNMSSFTITVFVFFETNGMGGGLLTVNSGFLLLNGIYQFLHNKHVEHLHPSQSRQGPHVDLSSEKKTLQTEAVVSASSKRNLLLVGGFTDTPVFEIT